MKNAMPFLIFLGALLSIHCQAPRQPEQEAALAPGLNFDMPTQQGVSHQLWDELLRQYVGANGKVNYQGLLKQNTKLQRYLDLLAANPPRETWPRDERMAYWINAYNAFTVKLILDNYPLKSIMDLRGGKVWDHKWITLGNETYSLNHIEHDILRPKYKDARIHFALNCAARSCPPLLNRAYQADNLDRLLEQQTKVFINDKKFNQISPKTAQVSKIFEWYAEDFGDLVAYLNRYSTTKIEAGAKLSFNEYVWALNE
jgi:hypothetical protein